MTLFSYKVFITSVEYMNFRKAAEKLGLTPSAVSHCISNMEEELGFPLFVRSKNRLSLTSNGELLLPYVRQLLMKEDEINSVVDDIKGVQRGTVKVGCFNTVCSRWMPQLVEEFHALYPDVAIEIYQGTYGNVSDWLENGEVDIGFLSASSAGKIPIELLYKDRLMAVVPKGFNTQKPETISIKELDGQQFVQPMENCDADSINLISESGIKTESKCHVVDDLSVLRMVESGFGVCILPKLVVDCFNVNVDVYPLEPETYRIIGVSCYEPSRNVPAVDRLYKMIVNKFSEFQ